MNIRRLLLVLALPLAVAEAPDASPAGATYIGDVDGVAWELQLDADDGEVSGTATAAREGARRRTYRVAGRRTGPALRLVLQPADPAEPVYRFLGAADAAHGVIEGAIGEAPGAPHEDRPARR